VKDGARLRRLGGVQWSASRHGRFLGHMNRCSYVQVYADWALKV
jgi:hypothetical protein